MDMWISGCFVATGTACSESRAKSLTEGVDKSDFDVFRYVVYK